MQYLALSGGGEGGGELERRNVPGRKAGGGGKSREKGKKRFQGSSQLCNVTCVHCFFLLKTFQTEGERGGERGREGERGSSGGEKGAKCWQHYLHATNFFGGPRKV